MHVSWILNKDKHETKGRRDGHSDGFGSTELLSHSAMTGNLQHVGSEVCGVGKDCNARSEQSGFTPKTLSNSLSLRGPCRYGIASPITDEMVSSWVCKEPQSFPLQRGRLVFHVFYATSSSSWHSLMCYNTLLHTTGTHRLSLQMVIELKEADLFIFSKRNAQK